MYIAALIGAFLGALSSTIGVPVWLLVVILFGLIVWRRRHK